MPADILRIAVAGAFALHGLGHFGGLPVQPEHWSRHSWLLTRPLGDGVVRVLGMILYTVAAIAFLVAAAGVFGIMVPPDQWRPLAIVGAVASLAAFVITWDVLPAGPRIGAVFDVIVLIALAGLGWPTQATLGR
jgi:hypothetical protein